MKTNKHLFLTLFAALALVLGTACSDDDNGGNDAGTADAAIGSDTGTADTGTTADSAVATAKLCVEACVDNEDCEISGTDTAGYTCGDNKRCVAPKQCTETANCVATFSAWSTACTDDAGCTFGVCIEDNGGVCAPEKTGDCLGGMTEHATKKMDGGAAVTVCANLDWACTAAGACGCANDNACASSTTLPTCDSDTGACKCKADPDSCGDNMKCLASGACGCANNDGCTLATYPTCDTDTGACKCSAGSCDTNMKCLDSGVCGCANDDGCTNGKCDTDTGACVCEDAATDCKADETFDGTDFVCDTL